MFKVAARLRIHELNYISLETALSDAGVISQIPLNWITLISSGRSHIVDCGKWGHIEFIHTKRPVAALEPHLIYDRECGLWRASVDLTLKDMKFTKEAWTWWTGGWRMSLFDRLVAEALVNQREPARSVEAPDIYRWYLLAILLWIQSPEQDLDFSGGYDFTWETLSSLASVLKKQLSVKYGLAVEVGEPVRESGNVDTWKLRVVTRPEQPHLPRQIGYSNLAEYLKLVNEFNNVPWITFPQLP